MLVSVKAASWCDLNGKGSGRLPVLVKLKKIPTKGIISKRVATVPKLCHGSLAIACDLRGMEHSRGIRSNVLLEPGRLLRLGPALQLEVLHIIISP